VEIYLFLRAVEIKQQPQIIANHLEGITTGFAHFAECQAKPQLHSANPLLSVTLGKFYSIKKVFAKPSLPSVFCRALGKYFAECPTLGKV
jgi:hypothetical protein